MAKEMDLELEELPAKDQKNPEAFPVAQSENNQDSSGFDSGSKPNMKAQGSSGTTIYGGYYDEEYLRKLKGRLGAKIYDEMRRSESQIEMILNAIMNPIKSASWEFEEAQDVPNAKKHRDFIEYNAKVLIDFETYLHEALTKIIFGYSLFEVVHSIKFNDPTWGTFNGLKALAFRSQKTIEKWNLNSDGDLVSVQQWISGDLAKDQPTQPVMDGRFIHLLTLKKEGDNYEGISQLRAMYGPYFRKNLYLKIAAIGAEKNAIGTPLGTVPAGKQDPKEKAEFQEVLENFTAHESAYIMIPDGWKIEILKSDFDPSKIKELILLENTEMINCVVANFLALGTNGGGGAFALGSDLSDFFLSGLQIYANIITGVWNRKLIPDLIKLNFGEQKSYPKMKATGINNKAGKELSEIIKTFVDTKVIKADDKLEEFARKQYSLPVADPTTAREAPVASPFGAPGAGGGEDPNVENADDDKKSSSDKAKASLDDIVDKKLSERHLKLAQSWDEQWADNKDSIKVIMQAGLTEMLEAFKKQISSAYKKATPQARLSLGTKLEPQGINNYREELKEALSIVANQALLGARKETKKASKTVKLSEAILLAAPPGGFYKALPKAVQKQVQAQAQLIAQSQAADMNKIVAFQYQSSAGSTEDLNQILKDIDDAVTPTIEGSTARGTSIDAAAGNAVSTISNEARLDWFFEPEVLDTLESFTFFNEDPVSEICQELNGMTWASNDPDLDRYAPPLHHNCKSRLVPNEKGSEGNPEIQRGGTPVSASALKSITLHEEKCACEHPYRLEFTLVEPKL